MVKAAFTFIDTNAVPWEDNPGIPGFKRRLLVFDDAARSEIRMDYVPPGAIPRVIELPHRHYHRTVSERAYALAGDFPHWEFSSTGDHVGEMILFRRHLFMDRPPRTIHGLMPEPLSETGCVLLYWNTGPGTGVAEPEAPRESVELPFDDSADADHTDFSDARLFDTAEVAWQEHVSAPGWKRKPLADAVENSGAVSLVHVPADWSGSSEPVRASAEAPSPWLFVIAGDLRIQLAEKGARRELALREGAFLIWRAGASLGVPADAVSDGGCTVLCVGHDLATTG
ncbi:MAG: hypothetical protein F4X06_02660 [Gammaproteobacteria bacterium]|nr:hypothetical protein [Gammaproteobacteria bacterium]MYD01235.1 hypothetical protein [Gammaproteobacteria bacterium]